jgi:universal protein Kae1
MIILGIESTAHTFGIGIIKITNNKKEILANKKSSYITDEGGMIPSKVAQHHVDNLDLIINSAITESKIKIKDINIIAYSQSPGIGHTLRIGAVCARTLAIKLKIPIVGVNHCIAHLEIGKGFTNAKDPVLLYVSGANTQVIAYEKGKYRIFGETLDIGLGNFLDSLARTMNLGFPGGPKIAEIATKGKKYIELPYVVKGMDVSFGGILTNLKQKIKSSNYKKEDLCYSAQETVFSMMIEVAERAMAHCNKNELLLGGGVACNKRLQEMAKLMCQSRNSKAYILPNELNVDNGVMIAWLGYLMFKAKNKGLNISKAGINPYTRTDEEKVYWK